MISCEIFSRRLPDIPLEEREALCVELLRDRYTDINQLIDRVQRALDEAQNLHIAPQHAPFRNERAHKIGNATADPTVPLETQQRRAESATATMTRAMHDDRMKKEADFRSRAGLKCYITRKTEGKCCAWCSAMAGRYEYYSEPKDVYRRHDNCGCSVTYENGRQRQDVWSKRTWEAPEPGAGAGEPVVLTKEQAAKLQAEKGLTKDSEHDIIKEKGMYRRTANTGPFEHLPERMSKKHIRELARKYDVNISGLILNIDFNDELLRFDLAGEAVPEHIGKITFFPTAFRSEEELIRTLVHERVHVEQYRKHGAIYVQEHMRQFENEAESIEEEFVAEARRKGLL